MFKQIICTLLAVVCLLSAGCAAVTPAASTTAPPVSTEMARLANDAHPDTADFLTFIRSSRARSVFEAQGFTVYGAPRS